MASSIIPLLFAVAVQNPQCTAMRAFSCGDQFNIISTLETFLLGELTSPSGCVWRWSSVRSQL